MSEVKDRLKEIDSDLRRIHAQILLLQRRQSRLEAIRDLLAPPDGLTEGFRRFMAERARVKG